VNTPISVRNEVCLSGTLYTRFWQPQSAVLGGAHSPRLLALSLCNDGSSTGSAGRAILVRLRRSFPGIYSACGATIRRWHGFVCVRGDDPAMARLCLRAGRRPSDGTALSIKRAIAASPPTSLVGRATNPALGLAMNRFSGSIQRVIAASRAVCALCGAHGGRGDMFRPLVPSSGGRGGMFRPWCRVLWVEAV